jgi:hypothetical protein
VLVEVLVMVLAQVLVEVSVAALAKQQLRSIVNY